MTQLLDVSPKPRSDVKTHTYTIVLALLLVLGTAGCGGSGEEASETAAEPTTTASGGAASGELTQEQLEKGIGPIQSVSLSASIEEDLAEKGEEIFSMKCTACHKMDQRYVGPPLGDVVERRTPEFVMNMMLNPEEMVQKHPIVKEMLGQYMTPMPNQGLTEDDARAVLEYLREVHEESEGAAQAQ